MNTLFSVQKYTRVRSRGFAMLFTVLIVTLILSIAISISTLTLRQTILSSLAKDSQVAFFAADAAVECGLYYDVTVDAFADPDNPPAAIDCGYKTLVLDPTSARDYLMYAESNPLLSTSCFSIRIDKVTIPGTNIVQGRGYNICGTNPRQVERTLETQY